ncbi:MAG: sensor domain-containing diguanylate cyclase [Planctomycetia bacterium]|nr:sensor domain-containing diguanylate cyclase [Planctomycetia bacterium]
MSAQNNFSTAPPFLLTLGVITVVMSQLSSLHPWIAGLSTFLALTVLMAIVALRSDPRTTALLCGVAALFGTVACWFCGADISVSIVVIVSAIGTGALATLSWLVCDASRSLQRQIAELKAHQEDLVRKLYEQEKSSQPSNNLAFTRPAVVNESTITSKLSTNIVVAENVAKSDSKLTDREFFDFAMLLLSMQQIGQKLSSQLDLRSLVIAIQDTAQEMLHCHRAELFLWNGPDQRLYKADKAPYRSTGNLPMTAEEIAECSESNPAFDWVTANHRILSRREVASGKLGTTISPELAASSLPAAIAPLMVGNELLGVLLVDCADDESPTFIRMLFILASHCALSVKNAQLFRHIEEMARRDSLTGLLNHASFLEELDLLVDHAHSNHEQLTLVMSDIDHFKNVNDSFGHQAGDHVLQEIANWWRAIMPDRALLARYGGEEFICVLPGDDLQHGRELAELLRASLEANPVNHGGLQLHVTASFGVAELGKPATNVTRLIRLADKALYRAKNAGRNRVDCHDPARPEIANMAESAHFVMPSEPSDDALSESLSEINLSFVDSQS